MSSKISTTVNIMHSITNIFTNTNKVDKLFTNIKLGKYTKKTPNIRDRCEIKVVIGRFSIISTPPFFQYNEIELLSIQSRLPSR